VSGPSTCCVTVRCGREPVAGGLCRRCYAYRRRHGEVPTLTGPQPGDRTGHGRFGILERTWDGVSCHECGGWYSSLAAHIRLAHDLTAAEYRQRYGLARRQPLVSLAMSEAMSTRSRDRVGSSAWRRLEAARDPVAAANARGRDLMVSRPAIVESRQQIAAANSAAQAIEHLCAVCGRPIARWRGADDRRTLCDRARCHSQSKRQAALAAAATRRAASRQLTAAEVRRLRSMSRTELASYIPTLYADRVRQRVIAAAVGLSANTVSRIAPYHGR
jgi:hypothetical protein